MLGEEFQVAIEHAYNLLGDEQAQTHLLPVAQEHLLLVLMTQQLENRILVLGA